VSSDWITVLTEASTSGTWGIDGTAYVETLLGDWALEGDYTGQNLTIYELYNPAAPGTPFDLVHPPSGMWAMSEMDWTAESCERSGQTWDAVYAPRTNNQITPHWKFLVQVAPKWIFINCEYNDVWRQYHPDWHNGSLQSVKNEYVKLVDKLQAACPTCEIVLMSSPPAGYERPKWLYDAGPPAKYKPLLYYGEITSEDPGEVNCTHYQDGLCDDLGGNPNEYDDWIGADGSCYLNCVEYFNPNHFMIARWIRSLAAKRGLRYVGLFDEVGRQYGLDAAGLDAWRDDYLTVDSCTPACILDAVHVTDAAKNAAFYKRIVIPAMQNGFRQNKASFSKAR